MKSHRRQASQDSSSGSPLHSIVEEEKRKPNQTMDQSPVEKSSSSSNKTSDTQKNDEMNKQTIYIRTPFDENQQQVQHAKHNSSIYIRPESDPLASDNQPNIPTRRMRRPYLNETNNKIEIDSDNVETPPVTRKHLHLSSSGGTNATKESNGENDKKKLEQELFLGDGQFDRFSSARRTRRFKRPIDLSNASDNNTTTNPSTTSPDSASEASFPIVNPTDEDNINSKSMLTKTEATSNEGNNTKEAKNKVNHDVVTRIGKIGKSISRISQEDVREAIRSLKSPTPEREWNVRDGFRTAPSNISGANKFTSHELNDEGFEETQSLVSDTPSLTTSSCNEEAKSKKENSPDDNTSSGNAASASPSKRRILKPSSQLQTLLARNQQSLERSRSLRTSALTAGTRSASTTPRRTNSLRKPEGLQSNLSLPKPVISSISNKRLDVERSNSRASLRSSRSSLNSAVSTNTVKKMPTKPSIPSSSSAASSSKRSLLIQNNPSTANKSSKNITRVPASRSSSSGSSIGPAIKKPPTPSKITSNANSSLRENQNNNNQRSKISPASSAASTKTNSSNSVSRTSPRASSFMRPTTASATKVKSK